MCYYHIIKSYQKLKLTLNVVVHVTFNHKPCHQFYYAMSHFSGESDYGDDMREITSEIMSRGFVEVRNVTFLVIL